MLKKLIVFLSFAFSCAFISIGFATLTTSLSVEGNASVTPPTGLYILSAEFVEAQGVEDDGYSYLFPTNLKTLVDVKSRGSITYKITLKNNSDLSYWYHGIQFVSEDNDGYDNELINQNNGISITTKDKLADNGATFDGDDWIPSNATRDFYVVYSFGSNAVGKTLTTLVNFSFGEKMGSYGDGVLAILNNPEKYAIISGMFDDAYAADGRTVIGNVGADEAMFDLLFGENLQVDGKDVTIMIERNNVDKKTTGDSYANGGPTGCEYTIYVTTDDPTTGTPTVFAISYTREPDGEWIQIGELYEGTTGTTTYVDSEGVAYTSFNTASWVAVKKTYVVFTYKGQTVTYRVNDPNGNSYQQQYKLTDLMSMQDQELFNQLNNPQILKDIYKILFKDHPNSTAPEIELLRSVYYDSLRFYQMRNNGQEFGLSNTATRAELLSTVENLAKAMDYYTQVHDTSHQ